MKLNLNISGYEDPLDLLLELSKKQKSGYKKDINIRTCKSVFGFY